MATSPTHPDEGALAEGQRREFEGVARASVAGAVAGCLTDGLAGVVAGSLAPLLERLMSLSATEVRSRNDRTIVGMQLAAERLGVDGSSRLLMTEVSESGAALVDRATEGMATSLFPERLMAIAQAVASGIADPDPAQIDVQLQVVDALSAMEKTHLVVLQSMTSAGDGGGRVPNSMRRHEIRAANQPLRAVLDRLLNNLQAQGMIAVSYARPDGDGEASPNAVKVAHGHLRYRPTAFGMHCLHLLMMEAEQLGSVPAGTADQFSFGRAEA